MAAPAPRVQLSMDCIEGVWESLNGGQRCQFHGTMRMTMTLLVHPKAPARVIEALIEWEQTTPADFGGDASTPLIGTPSDSEEDLKEDPEPKVDEDSVNDPEQTLSSEPTDGDSESSHRWRLEWLDHHYHPWRASVVEPAASAGDSLSSTAFLVVRVDMRQVDRPGPSGIATIASSSDSNSEEDFDRSNTEASSSGDI